VNFYAVTPQQLREMQVETLPRNLQEAIDALAESPLLREQLGERFVDEFIALKQDEWTDYHRHVSDWETARYLSFF